MFEGKAALLRALRILNEIESSLTRYVAVVSVVNIGVGLVTTAIAFAVGLPSPVLWGVVAFLLNYIPYVGPAIVAAILLVVGIVALPTLPGALLAPALFVGFVTVEGHFITPSLIGRQLTLSSLALFLSRPSGRGFGDLWVHFCDPHPDRRRSHPKSYRSGGREE